MQIFTEPLGDPYARRGFEAFVANRERTGLTRELLQRLPDLRIIAQTGNHACHIDLAAADEQNNIIAKATEGFWRSAAELAVGFMISVMRQIPSVDAQIKLGRWPTPMTRVLRGKALGIVGLGHVGRDVAKIASAFEMNVLAWSRQLTAETAGLAGAKFCELDDLLRCSDVVSISTLAQKRAV